MNPVVSYNRNQITLRAYDHESISVGAVAIGLTAAKVKLAWLATIKVESAMVRFWKDGSVPTSSDGYPAFDGEQIELTREEALLFQAIRVGGTNATLWVDYHAG